MILMKFFTADLIFLNPKPSTRVCYFDKRLNLHLFFFIEPRDTNCGVSGDVDVFY